MASADTLLKKALNVNGMVVESHRFYDDDNGVKHLRMSACPNAWHLNDCPFCHRRLPGYDTAAKKPKVWRALDFGGILVDVEYRTHRVKCPKHGVVTADVPWAYPDSNFTRDFDLTVAWLAKYLPRSAVSSYMRIDWETVGNCISRSLHDLEPERSRRLNGLVNIGIDETSYRKGHMYITVIVNHDTNEVVWVADGHGKSVLEQFYRILTPEQLSSIKVVTGDGARWITDCVNEFTPDCERCIDPFHVVEWATDALDEVCRDRWRKAYEEASHLAKEHPQKRGHPKANDRVAAAIKAARSKASEIKDSVYSLGKAPEHLTERQQVRLDLIQEKDPQLYRAYSLKESLRLLLKIPDVDQATKELKHWLFWASHSRVPAFKELYRKIKLIIRKAYGFRNIQNMMDMVYLVCSNVLRCL